MNLLCQLVFVCRRPDESADEHHLSLVKNTFKSFVLF